jgi:hypothetical protein
MPLALPPMLIQFMPQSMQEGARLWAGRSLPFVRIGNEWRADIDGLGRVEGHLESRKGIPSNANVVEVFLDEAKIQSRLADDVSNHRFRNWADAQSRWNREENRLGAEKGFQFMNVGFFPAPPRSGVPDLKGDWEGVMDLFGTGVAEGASTQAHIVLKLRGASGSYHATVDCIEMGRKDYAIGKVTYDYPLVRLQWNSRTSLTLTINSDATQMFFSVDDLKGPSKQVVLTRSKTPDQVLPRLSDADFQPRPDSELQGYWKGTIGDGADAMPVDVKIARESDGGYRGEFDSPMLGSNSLLMSVLYSRPTLKLLVKTGAGMFRGEIDDSATEIRGSWIQDGRAKPANFKRGDFQAEHAHDAERDYSYTSSADLQGHWKGSWNFLGTKIRLALDIAKLADGSLSAALTNIDQFGNDDPIPASDFQYSPSAVHMKWKWAGGAFDGELMNGRLTGAWKQGGASFPLIFTRAAVN